MSAAPGGRRGRRAAGAGAGPRARPPTQTARPRAPATPPDARRRHGQAGPAPPGGETAGPGERVRAGSGEAASGRGFRSTARMPWQEAARRQKMSADGGRHTRTRFRHTVDGTHEDRGTHARHTDTLRPYKQKHKALVAPLSRYRSHARVSGRVSQYQSQAALDLAITSRTASIATRRWRRCHQARTP